MKWPAIKRELLRRGDVSCEHRVDCQWYEFRMRGSPERCVFFDHYVEDDYGLTRRRVRQLYNSMRRRRVYT